jgi:hypothetical protein
MLFKYKNIVYLYLYKKPHMSKKALLIGINYYETPSAKLNGCINDVVNVRNMLIDAYGYEDTNITVLRDDTANKPTAANIVKQLTSIVAQSASLGQIWVHYSGHGSQIYDINCDETDYNDEVIVPSDFTTFGVITDDMIFSIIKQSRCPTILVFDSCNSGTVCDLAWNFNAVSATQVSVFKTNNSAVTNQNIFCFSGCRDEQTSADIYNISSAQSCGALSTAFIESLRLNKHNVDVKTLYLSVVAYLKQMGMNQIPQFSSSSQKPVYQLVRAASQAAVNPQRVALVMQSIMRGISL